MTVANFLGEVTGSIVLSLGSRALFSIVRRLRGHREARLERYAREDIDDLQSALAANTVSRAAEAIRRSVDERRVPTGYANRDRIEAIAREYGVAMVNYARGAHAGNPELLLEKLLDAKRESDDMTWRELLRGMDGY